MFFNRDGQLININKKACETLHCEREEILAEHVTFQTLFNLPGLDIKDTDGYYFTQLIDTDNAPKEKPRIKSYHRSGKLFHEIRLMTVYNDERQLFGMYAIGRDVTSIVRATELEEERAKQTKEVVDELTEYINNINYILQSSGVRMASYSPKSHTLTILSGINKVQLELTQARCMTLVHDKDKRKTMRILNNMDNYTENPITNDILTNVRLPHGNTMHLQFHFVPTHNEAGEVVDYFGLCRDITEAMVTQQRLREETEKAKEIENTQNSFLKNMSHEIRTPLNAVVGFAELFETEHSKEDEDIFVQEILHNSDALLNLINDILFLSRIDAKMVEIKKQPCDFAAIFESYCQQGWERYKKEGVNYIIENPYEQLVVDIDTTNMGHIIEQITANAAQNTYTGTVRARYDYIGRRLMISVEDSGSGIPQKELIRIYERFRSGPNKGSGLGLPICKELTEQMGGTLEINSEVGQGTTVWITIPCQSVAIKRRKYI